MKISELISWALDASKGNDNFEVGVVGSNGYGFVFKDLESNIPYVAYKGSGKIFEAGSYRDVLNNFKRLDNIENISDLHTIDFRYDLILAGALKTLIPTLKFGGYELLFDVWMFVTTPDKKRFPARFYHGQSGTSVAGWGSDNTDPYTGEKVFPKEFEKIINFSPSNFTEFEKNLFLDALEFALQKVPISDFWGVKHHDFGNSFMGINRGRPFIRELGFFGSNPKAEKEIEPLLDKDLTTLAGETFRVYILPETKTYVIDFGYDQWFGDSKKTLETVKSFQDSLL